MADLPSSRKEAKKIGSTRYYTEKACKHGHISERLASNGRCLECLREREKALQGERRERRLEKTRQYRARHREYISELNGAWRDRNPGKVEELNRQRRQELRPRECKNARERRRANPAKYRAYVQSRRARKLEAIPLWVTATDLTEAYSGCPPDQQVDHIVPLGGKLVCGLHCPANLRYVSKEQNYCKGNKWDPWADSVWLEEQNDGL